MGKIPSCSTVCGSTTTRLLVSKMKASLAPTLALVFPVFCSFACSVNDEPSDGGAQAGQASVAGATNGGSSAGTVSTVGGGGSGGVAGAAATAGAAGSAVGGGGAG